MPLGWDRSTSADVGRQAFRTGLVDVISVHLVPVLFGSGTRMFEDVVDEYVTLELLEMAESPHATHPRYRVVRDG
jgi:dihydrofolate reductase